MRASFKIGSLSLNFEFSLLKINAIDVLGYSNRTKDGLFCVFLDYDNYQIDWLVNELSLLGAKHHLGHFFIFQSSEKSFHAVCLQKLTAQQFSAVLDDSSCDKAFRAVPKLASYKSWILRFSPKGEKERPTFLSLLDLSMYEPESFEISEAHFIFLRKSGLLPRDIANRFKRMFGAFFDGNAGLEVIRYKTGSRVVL